MTKSQRDGYRANSEAKSDGFIANFGYRLSPILETRFYFRERYTSNRASGALTLGEVARDPKQLSPTVSFATVRIQPGSTWLANKTTLEIDADSTLEFGVVWHDYPIQQFALTTLGTWVDRDLSGSLRYNRSGTLFGLKSNTTIGVVSTTHLKDTLNRKNLDPITKATTMRTKSSYTDSADENLFFNNDLELVPKFWATTGIAEVHIGRKSNVTFPLTSETGAPYNRNSYYTIPRLGLRYEITPEIQVFGNISKSVEPPNAWAVNAGPPFFTTAISGAAANGLASGSLDFKDQTATSFEVGVRGKVGIFEGSLGYFRSKVKNELLTVIVVPSTPTTDAVTAQSNASPTIKQGIEASLNTILWQAINRDAKSTEPKASPHRLSFRQAYTYNNFKYINAPEWHSNKLPGLPDQFYQGELFYEHPIGIFAGIDLQHASTYELDYANTLKVPAYTLYGAKIGFTPRRGAWQLSFDARNLGDKHYVSSIAPVYNAKGNDLNQRAASPGDGFGVTAVFSFGF